MTIGRFAPTPSGYTHVGNAFCYLLAWLSAKKQGGQIVLRMEDLDTLRCPEWAMQETEEDLKFLGLNWDFVGPGPSRQSQRTEIYEQYFNQLVEKDLVYPCFCSRTDVRAASAPHLSDGRVVYPGLCANLTAGEQAQRRKKRAPAWRMRVPEKAYTVQDGRMGAYTEYLPEECGDFIIRRADLVFAYQLAVVVDDALMGVTEVVRSSDLIFSTPRQIYLYEQLGFPVPKFIHIPTILDEHGGKLSKRDNAIAIRDLREKYTAQEILGKLGWLAGIRETSDACTLEDLLKDFDWSKVPKEDILLPTGLF